MLLVGSLLSWSLLGKMRTFSIFLTGYVSFARDKLLITPYGFDGTKFDPSKDKFLPAKYSANNIEGKALCKVALRHHLGFSKRSFAIVCYVVTLARYNN